MQREPGWYWARSANDPDESPRVIEWTGKRWLECGVGGPFMPKRFEAIGDRITPPEEK